GVWQWLGDDSPAPSPARTLPATADAARPARPAPSRADPSPRSQSEPEPVIEEPVDLIDPLLAAEQGEPIPELTVQDPLVQLLGLAAANIRAQRYTTPPVTNALDRYKLALLIEP